MLHLFFAVGFSAAPLILLIPPVRNFNLLVAAMEDLLRESSVHTSRIYPAVRYACSRVLDCMLCSSAR
ncbi:hypothetical protein HanRHA438_Chr11g0510861 [Helianthus annuus]|uniref:Uncharacterized protein n=1 Tax=Helianthus annuus TaxID=4232 RepID=A0A251TAM1_HELAN|nr:hypothetical protein HanXRQr2_Chr11g0498221 [Helianthus annuus]KAJ0502095.1 hypothetical protein HanHA300_Chr11g0408781 [Helianthus annuus]KAJ0510066.1 hypothetical protein HanIR_Chr11g0536431 [Helianthus annuus]KAJ0518019.1 hypothetical protein HanHA89_Chr11g0432481 [Helianthus annuus]KAJ0686039.1 hypothetical protein HanLR1_Chr11g0410021 [Helianthus annuus]